MCFSAEKAGGSTRTKNGNNYIMLCTGQKWRERWGEEGLVKRDEGSAGLQDNADWLAPGGKTGTREADRGDGGLEKMEMGGK